MIDPTSADSSQAASEPRGDDASRLARFRAALEERFPFEGAWRTLLDERVPGGAGWAYVFGSALAILLLLQFATGLLLSLDYAPTSDAAHASVSRIQGLEWGAFIRAAHHHGASFLVVALVLHLLQVTWYGAYRKPRELNWLTGLALALVLFGFAFTGYLLPWDQNAYYATRVGVNIAHGTPLVGPWLAQLMKGGDILGNLTLTRFYALHVIVFPAATVALLAVHLMLFRRHGVTPAARLSPAELDAAADTFWPRQALRDLVVGLVAVAALWAVAATVPAPLGSPADPSTPLDAMPEWYFYWLFELLHWFEPPLEWVATMAIPGLILAFLVFLPWLDRADERHASKRRAPLAVLLAILGGIAILTGQVMLEESRAEEGAVAGAGTSDNESETDLEIVDPLRAAILYGEHCTDCHGPGGEPREEDATDFRTADFRRMAANDFEALVGTVEYGGLDMPAFGDELSVPEIRAILREIVIPFAESGAPSASDGAPARDATGDGVTD